MKRSVVALIFCLLSLASFAQNPKDVLYSCYKTAFVDQLDNKPYVSALVSAVTSTFRMDNTTMQRIIAESTTSDTSTIRSIVTQLTEHLFDDDLLSKINKEYDASMIPVMQTYVDIVCPVITDQMAKHADLSPIERSTRLAGVSEMAATLAQSDPVMIRTIREYSGAHGSGRAMVMSKVIGGYAHMKCRYMRDDLIDILVVTALNEYSLSRSVAYHQMQEDIKAYILTGSADTMKKYFHEERQFKLLTKALGSMHEQARSLKLGKFSIWHTGGALTMDNTTQMYFAGNISKPQILGGLKLKAQWQKGKLLLTETEFIPVSKVPNKDILLNMASDEEMPPMIEALPDTK